MQIPPDVELELHISFPLLAIEIESQITGEGKQVRQWLDANPESILALCDIPHVMNLIFNVPVITNALSKLFDGFVQGTDVIAGLLFLNDQMLSFEQMPITGDANNRR